MNNYIKNVSICFVILMFFGDLYFLAYYNFNSTIVFILFFSECCVVQCIYKCIKGSSNIHQSVQLPNQPIYNPVICIEITNNTKLIGKEICTICLDENNEDLVELTCKHIFHRACIEEWNKIQNYCPNCRNDMTLKNTDEDSVD